MGATPDEARSPDADRPSLHRAAAALRYDPASDAAPRVVAAGFGAMAEAILRRAREAGIVQVTSPLAPVLARIPPGQAIPPALFEVVAQIMALALDLDRQMAEGASPSEGPRAGGSGGLHPSRADEPGRDRRPSLAARWGIAGEPGSTRGTRAGSGEDRRGQA